MTPLPRRAITRHMLIFKIFRPEEWQTFHEAGATAGAPVDVADGFIHFSTAEQLLETAEKHFAGETGLMVLAVEADDLGDALKWEKSRGGQDFPHLYRPLRLADVLWARSMAGDGAHVLPDGVDP